MPQEITQVLVTAATSTFAAFIGWFLGRRKQTAEAVNTELDAVQKAITIWRDTAAELRVEVARLKNEVGIMAQRINELHEDNNKLRAELLQHRNQTKK